MKLDSIHRSRQFRGETSPSSDDPHAAAVALVEAVRSGDYHGRYFTWNDPGAAASYGQVLIECKISPKSIITERGCMAIIDDWMEQDIQIDIKEQRAAGVPRALTERYIEFVRMKKSGEIGSDCIMTVDGCVPIAAIPTLVEISMRMVRDGDQIILIDRPLHINELIACYVTENHKVVALPYGSADATFAVGDRI